MAKFSLRIIEEHGHDAALYGMSLSFFKRDQPVDNWWEDQREKAFKRAGKLAHMHGGHNKFLESIVVWIDINAPRSFWSQFDTYRSGVTKQSESTMHTLGKRELSGDDFSDSTCQGAISMFVDIHKELMRYKGLGGVTDAEYITRLKDSLPEGFMQRRVVCTNYKTLQNIVAQRGSHRLSSWPEFCEQLREQAQYPEWIFKAE